VVSKDGVTKKSPFVLYFNNISGVLNGFTLRTWHSTNSALPIAKYWQAPLFAVSGCKPGQCADITVILRDPSKLCVPLTNPSPVGDSVTVLSNNGRGQSIALTSKSAQGAGWTEGNCINKMGIHHSLDVNNPGKPRYFNVSSLFPVLPMYSPKDGTINAVLIHIPEITTVFPFGPWEGPFPSLLFCKNWCGDGGCHFGLTKVFSTLHFYFKDPATLSCDGARCKL